MIPIHLPFDVTDGVVAVMWIAVYLLPLVAAVLLLAWLYQSKKSLDRIDRNLEEINNALRAGSCLQASSQEKGSEHEQH